MSYILSTTYPSEHGLVAAMYACGLATTLGCPLKLVHGYTVPVTFGEMPMPVLPAEDARMLAAGQIETATARLRSSYPEADISSELLYGVPADVLEEAAQGAPPLLTVIGNDEEADAGGWIGSHAADMLRDAGHPVLAVPHAAVYRKPAHICIAVDDRSLAEGASAAALLQLQAALGFRITVLHVLQQDERPAPFGDTAFGRQLTPSGAAYVELSTSRAVDTAIADYAVSEQMDWLAVFPHHYGFWEGLFHKSHTAQMLHLGHLPILGLH